jgi:hypothetical protein
MSSIKSLIAIAIILLTVQSIDAQAESKPSAAPKVTLEKVWIDYDVFEEELNGMKVHLAFSVSGLGGKPFTLLYTILDEDESPLMNEDGNVVEFATDPIEVSGDTTSFKDVSIFIPYGAFGLDDGDHSLIVDIDMVHPDVDGELHITAEPFAFSKGGREGDDGPSFEIEFSDLVVTQNVTRDGAKGLAVSLKLPLVKGLKGVDCAVAVTVMDMSETPIMAATPEFASESGHLVGRYTLKPAHEAAKFDKVEVFIPYGEITVPAGTRTLKLDIDVVDSVDELIKHLAIREFEFTKTVGGRPGEVDSRR